MRVEDGFQPVPFQEDNPYTSDPVLPSLLKRTLPSSAFQEINPDLERLGADVVTTIRPLGSSSRVYPPRLTQYDQWGRRVDDLETSEGWRDLKAYGQKEGLPGIFYERKYNEHSRSYGFAKMLLMVGDVHVVFCPLSMTDGTARVIELMGSAEMKEKILPRLISRDPDVAFTSGQWMTERPGGSDVSQTETVATPTGVNNAFGPQYTLNGFKWFSSATDSHVSVALARTGSPKAGSRGLSLFLVPLRLPLLRSPSDPVPPATSNNIFVHRLKNKIGTQIVPTAELSLEGSEAYLIGNLNEGVKSISPVLNITRVWSAVGSVGGLRRCLAIATAYAKVRSINGGTRLLQDSPLHVSQLAAINVLYRALTHLTFGAVRLLGKSECGVADADELRRLRMLTPIVKAFAAEKACAGMEEAMTALGGAGYMEENGFGRIIRDSLVEKIWEGTTTVLALDLARASQDPAVLNAFLSWVKNVVSSCPSDLHERLQKPLNVVNDAVSELASSLKKPIAPLVPRPALILAGYVTSSTYLLEHVIWSHTTGEDERETDVEVLRRWILEGGMVPATEDVRRATQDTDARVKADSTMIFGRSSRAKL
ncbi:putative acyl-CoA dehydrogenase, C-terminal domain [Lyophyllum shimeji]|uniref:Acyl-CoA dehydrogenase, C-terminal domain n=1 Tax=Lyophyllum shimeji TaxID=47721 RepID=A0A9P3PLX5_LYOSH|nr:putative acyl-CoA dehydrogenase, C-terminal domain [Lyophyllum shimeji]